MVTGPGPYYAPWPDMDRERARRDLDDHTCGCTSPSPSTPSAGCGRAARCCSWAAPAAASRGPGLSLIAAVTAAQPALVANLAVEVAPIRVNLIAAGFVDTPLSASLLGADLDKRREQLGAPTLPIRRATCFGRDSRSRRAHHDEHGADRRDGRHDRG